MHPLWRVVFLVAVETLPAACPPAFCRWVNCTAGVCRRSVVDCPQTTSLGKASSSTASWLWRHEVSLSINIKYISIETFVQIRKWHFSKMIMNDQSHSSLVSHWASERTLNILMFRISGQTVRSKSPFLYTKRFWNQRSFSVHSLG